MTQYADLKETWYEIPSPAVLFWPGNDWRSLVSIFDIRAFEGSYGIPPFASKLPAHGLITSVWIDTWVSAAGACELIDEAVRNWEITQDDIPAGEPYRIIKPIPVKIEREHETDFTATFDAGNISIGGETFQDAFRWLVLEILDTLDSLLECTANLGPDAERQL